MIEIFKDIQGYEGYQIGSLGNVKSLKYNKILKPKNVKQYLQVNLYKQGIIKTYLVHRLVAEAFIPNPQNLPFVNHRDEDKKNNAASNLEWCTREYNNNYGTRNKRIAESHINNPKQSKRVLCLETGVVYPSTSELERELGFSKGNISSACTGRLKQAYGFHWKYVE